uniref:D-glycerate dehydrogenase n=1 Tax=Ignisphaera aggregans TaxID=334771 RepID=A0A7C5TI92_9CREN
MEKPRVLLTAPIHSDGVKILESFADVVIASKPLKTEDELINVVRDFDAVISMGFEPFTKNVLEKASKLLVVARHGVGYDNIDVDAATRLGIWVTITPIEELFDAVADHAMALLLCLARRICYADRFVKSGEWFINPFGNRVFVGVGLKGKIVGVIGLGRIGSRIAERVKGFGVKAIYYDIERKVDLEKKLGLEYSTLDELLRNSDFIVVAVPLTEKTKGLIGKREISLMKPDAMIINISRGGVIDHNALVEALKNRRIAGVALDVFYKEPLPPDDEITKLQNIVLTPHIAWLTEECRKSMAITVAEEVSRVLRGEDPLYPVNPSVKELARNRKIKIIV